MVIKNQFILQELRTKIDQACRTAEEFTKLYYESLDKRRYVSHTNLSQFTYIIFILTSFVH